MITSCEYLNLDTYDSFDNFEKLVKSVGEDAFFKAVGRNYWEGEIQMIIAGSNDYEYIKKWG